MAAHSERFPGETAEYREARDRLLEAEQALARQVWAVAALRRGLPPGGEVPADYVFDEGPADLARDEPVRKVRMSELFADGKDTLVLYNFMYGPAMDHACPMCTSMLDSLDGTARHATQRVNLAVVARSPIARIREHARARGWRHFRLLSSAGNDYNRDYKGEDAEGNQMPMLNVFTRRDGKIRHSWGTEMLFAPVDGEEACHVDMIWPLWNLLDMTPEGRGTDFYPQLKY